MLKKYDVLGVGSPFVDHIIEVQEEFLAEIPGAKGGMVAVDYETLSAIIKKSAVEPVLLVGGSGANTIRGLAHFGHQCALVGKIGRDVAGKKFLERLSALKITSCLLPTMTPTAQVVCLVTPDGERTMRSFLGAGQEMGSGDLRPEIFAGISLVHIEGYTLLNGDLTERAMQFAKEAGAKVSFDLGSFEVVERHKQKIVNLLARYVDIVFANREEVRSLTQLEPQQGCGALTDLCETAVVLIGKEGCWAGRGTRKVHCPAYNVLAVDTTGAGDFFASGFLHGYLEKDELEECARYGSLTGAAVVQVKGVEITHDGWEAIKQEIAKSRSNLL